MASERLVFPSYLFASSLFWSLSEMKVTCWQYYFVVNASFVNDSVNAFRMFRFCPPMEGSGPHWCRLISMSQLTSRSEVMPAILEYLLFVPACAHSRYLQSCTILFCLC